MPSEEMVRTVSTEITADVLAFSDLVLAVAAAPGPAIAEELHVAVGGLEMVVEDVLTHSGSRLHVAHGIPPGQLTVSYQATVTGRGPAPEATLAEQFEYSVPSRYADSDRLGRDAHNEFPDVTSGKALLDSIVLWVNQRLSYVSGSSRLIDGASETYLAHEGVCRDFAHLAIAMLRAKGMPARLVSVYAPGLAPMDYHAVVEACIDGQWYVADPTTMAPRESMLRIATGRDAADTAFMTVPRGNVQLSSITVSAVVDPTLPVEDTTQLVRLT